MRRLQVLLIVLGTLTAMLVCAGAASARSTTPSAGTITLKLSAAARGRMDAVNVRVSGKRMRITRGAWSFDRLADDGGGTLSTRGRLRFRRGRIKVDIRDLQFSLVRDSGSGRYLNGMLSGKIGKTRYRLGQFVTRRYRSSPGRFDGLEILLSPTLTGNLNRALQAIALNSVEMFGTAVGRGITDKIAFAGGRVRVSLSDPTRQAFAGAGASITALPEATGAGAAVNPFSMPVNGDNIDLVTQRGQIALQGGLRFGAPPGGSFGGSPIVDATGLKVTATEDGYLLSTSKGLSVFSAIEDSDSTFDRTSKVYRHTSLALQFTYPAAELFAPALGMTAPQLLALPKGQIDIEATLAGR
jgi:hypothetical protein